MEVVMENWLKELGRLALRLMEINHLSANLYAEKKEIEKNMNIIKERMIEYAGTTGETIGEVKE
jgi:hypothetical protein